MCGILAVLNFNGEAQQVAHALNLMTHRGPDAHGLYQYERHFLGHRRLAIQDTSHLAAQPMVAADGQYVLSYNGELYNHLELRSRLEQKGIVFKSKSDTETLLYGLIEYGLPFLKELNGIFAFTFLDLKNQKLLVVRDAFGVKPLYYSHYGECLYFASEIRSIRYLSPQKQELNTEAFYQNMVLLWTPGTATAYQNIKKLKPGHYIEVSLNDVNSYQEKAWYVTPFIEPYPKQSSTQWQEALETHLKRAVKRQLIADRPLGFFLSGGIDSSLIVALAQEYLGKERIQSYCISTGKDFSKEGFKDDAVYAQRLAKQWGIALECITANSAILDQIDQMVVQLEELQSDVAPIFVGQIAQKAQSMGIPVLLGGAAADDIFTGYRRHQALYFYAYAHYLPKSIQRLAQRIIQALPQNPNTRRAQKWATALTAPLKQQMYQSFYWTATHKAYNCFTEAYQQHIRLDSIEQYFDALLQEIAHIKDPITQLLHIEQQSFLSCHNLNYLDKMGMAYGVEIRVPYLDADLVQLVAQMPPKLKMKQWHTKYILKKVAQKYLPKELIQRPKTGFGAPLRVWLQKDKQFQTQVYERLNQLKKSAMFQTQAIEQVYQDALNGTQDAAYSLLSLLVCESWLRQHHFTN